MVLIQSNLNSLRHMHCPLCNSRWNVYAPNPRPATMPAICASNKTKKAHLNWHRCIGIIIYLPVIQCRFRCRQKCGCIFILVNGAFDASGTIPLLKQRCYASIFLKTNRKVKWFYPKHCAYAYP
ncbi:hypothetical protein C7N83_12715 [Neisseria iguanae]|uniref:Uncharacterized protein n=1 Tax=Neisseria iguanae TaxID=90242 RepID=A0A2P7TXA1_9NEIS|nr:hypothetical protein C7N83_12715 [Neisseria iguanae]